jgi:phosphate transport system substrate-binding protein
VTADLKKGVPVMHRKLLSLATVFSLSISAEAAIADQMKIGGTGAVHGVMLLLSEAHSVAHPQDKIEVVPGLGSSGGISAAGEGAIHMAISSRALKAEEKARGLESSPLFDTPFVFVTSHPQPQRLKTHEVLAIYDRTLTRWPDGKDIRPILRPKSDSVTSFLIASFDGIQKPLDKLRQSPDVLVAATDQDNVDAAEKIPNSFTGMTLVQFMSEKPRLRTVALDGLEASVEAMEKGTYVHKMRMHTVMKYDPSPVARRFANFLRTPQAEKILRENGAVLLVTQTVTQR